MQRLLSCEQFCEQRIGPLSPILPWTVWRIKLFYFEILFKYEDNKLGMHLPSIGNKCNILPKRSKNLWHAKAYEMQQKQC